MVESIAHIGEDVHLRPRRAGSLGRASALEFVGLGEIEADVKKPGADLAIFENAERPVIADAIFVVILSRRDGVKTAALLLKDGRQVDIHWQLGINTCSEIVARIDCIAPFIVKIVIVHRQPILDASTIFLVTHSVIVSVVCIDNEDAETLTH